MTWKTKVSKANVLLFQLQASVHGIKEKGSGSSPTTYPTPTRGMYKQDVKDNGEYARRIKEKGHQIMLPAFVKLYPTPTTMDHIDRKGMRPSRAATNRKTGYLSEMIKMYPTPVVSDHLHNQSESIENWTKRAEEKKKQGINLHFALRHHVQMYPTPTQDSASERTKKYSQGGMPLPMAVKMFPTPSASCHMDVVAPPETVTQNNQGWSVTRVGTGTKFGAKLNDVVNKLDQEKLGGRLNPNFVEFLMGYPMNWTKIDPTE